MIDREQTVEIPCPVPDCDNLTDYVLDWDEDCAPTEMPCEEHERYVYDDETGEWYDPDDMEDP
jgi:hypothetical protein